MTVPLPSDDQVLLEPPGADEVALLARGVVAATRPAAGPTELQRVLVEAQFRAMTGHQSMPPPSSPSTLPSSPPASPAGTWRFAPASSRS